MDCFTKTMTLIGLDGKWVVFRGERNAIPNCVISTMTVSKLMRKGCMTHLAYVIDSKKGEVRIENFHIIR